MENSSVKFMGILCLCIVGFSAKAQVIQDENGRPLAIHYTNVQGSPFLADHWTKGKVKLADGETFDNMDLKYDQVTDQLIFKNSMGAAMTFVKPVNEFTLATLTSLGKEQILFRNGYSSTSGNAAKTFYQVLSDGETPLLKRRFKKISENKPYSSATVVKTFEEIHNYYLVQQGKLVKIENDKKAIVELLGDYKSELEAFIKSNNLSFKAQTDLVMLVTYYNSLK